MDKAAGKSPTFHAGASRIGATSFVVAVSLALLAGFSALAVDYVSLHHIRGALRTAAERGAVAGAGMLVDLGSDSGSVRDATVRAAQSALSREDSPELSVRASDVVFLKAGRPDDRKPDQVEVTAGRTDLRGNPVNLFMGGLLGHGQADVSARAGAGLFCCEASSGLAPLVIPAGFSWDDACDPHPQRSGNGFLDTASPCEAASVRVAGYGPADVGACLELSPGRDGVVFPGAVYAVRDGVSERNGDVAAATEDGTPGMRVAAGDRLELLGDERAAKVLFDQAQLRLRLDPGAYWDQTANAVRGSRFASPGDSPRTARVAFFDPETAPGPGRRHARIHQLGAVFIEELREGGKVAVRLLRALAVAPQRAGAACDPDGVGLYGVELLPGEPGGRMD
jgi:hypothetical protein